MPRRILLLITDLEIGGTPTVVRELATRLHGQGVDVAVASLKGVGPNGALLAAAGVPVTALSASSAFSLPRVVRRLRRMIVEQDVGTVFSFLVHANVVAALAVPAGVRLLQSIQTTQPRPAWHWRVQRWAARRAERLVVPSPSVVDAGILRSRIPREKFLVVPNAVDPSEFPRSGAPLAERDGFVVGFIGRLDPVKRIGDLVAAMPGSEVDLHIYGDGPERERLLRAREMTGGGRINVHGAVRRPQDALSKIGLLILPSEAEGFGLVLIEAMAAGVPAIGTDVPGIRDVIQHDVNGLLVPVANPRALRAAIGRLIDDRELRLRLIENGLRTVHERYTWDRILPQYRALLGLAQS